MEERAEDSPVFLTPFLRLCPENLIFRILTGWLRWCEDCPRGGCKKWSFTMAMLDAASE